MKKLLVLVVLAALLFSLSIPVSAASDTYRLPDLGLEISIPSEYTVLTRDLSENSPVFTELGMTKAQIMTLFEADHVYLDALSAAIDEEIVVTMIQNDISNMSYISDSLLLKMAKEIGDAFRTMGREVSEYDIYRVGSVKYIRVYYTDTATNAHSLLYYTIYDNKAINITIHAYKGSLTSQQETTIKNIVDSIQFKNVPSDTGETTEPFLYTDYESGLTFTVPANWKEKDFYEDRETLDVKFTSTKEPDLLIMYGSADMWSELTPAEKTGLTREDINNSMLTKEIVAQMWQTTPDKVSTVYYNGVSYVKCEGQKIVETAGLEVSVTMTLLTHVDKGWMYVFEFGGTSDDALYSDFESLVKSVKYPAASTEAGSAPSNNPSLEYDKDYDTSYNNPGDILLVVLPIVAVVVIGVVIYRKIQEKRQEKMLDYGSPEPQPPIAAEQRDFCRKCGQLLPSDSVFCHFCGTKIEKES